VKDARVAFRAIAGVSLLKAYVPTPILRKLVCSLPASMRSADDQAVLLTALVNLSGSGGVCLGAAAMFLESLDSNLMDAESAAASLLLSGYLSSSVVRQCQVPVSLSSDFSIPNFATELTEKSNPALPKNPAKKKRLAARAVARAAAIADQLGVDEEIETTKCAMCRCRESMKNRVWEATFAESVARLLKAKNEIDGDIGKDVLSGLFCLDTFDAFGLKELRQIDELLTLAIEKVNEADTPTIPFEDESKKFESSVVRTVKSLGFPDMESPHRTASNHRVTVCIL
jgi:hypothetical protein